MNITNRTTKAELIEYVKYLESECNRLNSLTFELNTVNEDFRRKWDFFPRFQRKLRFLLIFRDYILS